MVEIKNIGVYNLYNAILGARNPMNSWEKSDSVLLENGQCIIGNADLTLCQKLIDSGHDSHSKFLRQIFVSMDINAPIYW